MSWPVAWRVNARCGPTMVPVGIERLGVRGATSVEEAVTGADVRRVAQKSIQPGRFAVVVVGDQKVIEPRIQALNLGPIKKLTVDEVFGPKP